MQNFTRNSKISLLKRLIYVLKPMNLPSTMSEVNTCRKEKKAKVSLIETGYSIYMKFFKVSIKFNVLICKFKSVWVY